MIKKILIAKALICLTFSFSSPPCTGGTDDQQIGNLCLSSTELDTCNQNLATLDPSPTENQSINNTCTPYSANNEQAYNFNIQFTDFTPNFDCLDFVVKFENTTLPEGTADFNEYEYDSNTTSLQFNIPHSTLDSGDCHFNQTDTQYLWLCNMSLDIQMGGISQLQYNFKMQVILNRTAFANNNGTEWTEVHIIPNDLAWEHCCHETIGFESALRYCTNMTCTEYLPSPLTIERGEEFVVEHYITSPEFQHYYLKGESIKLGPYHAVQVETDGTQPGRYIWKIKGNIAMNNLAVESISRLHLEQPLLRFLQEEQEAPQFIKAQSQMSIVDDIDSIQNEDQKDQEQVIYKNVKVQTQKESNMNMLYIVIAVGAFTILSVIGCVIFNRKRMLKNQKLQQQRKEQYKQQSTACQNLKLQEV